LEHSYRFGDRNVLFLGQISTPQPQSELRTVQYTIHLIPQYFRASSWFYRLSPPRFFNPELIGGTSKKLMWGHCPVILAAAVVADSLVSP
jgi:hypothetical protein